LQSLKFKSHAWQCKNHVLWIPKYRKMKLSAELRVNLGVKLWPPPGLLGQHPLQPNQRCGAGSAGTTTIVPPPGSPFAPSAPVIPVAPVAPFSAGVPGAPCGPAGPGTVTTTGGAGAAAGVRSHALNAIADNTAATTIKYLMMILLSIVSESVNVIAVL